MITVVPSTMMTLSCINDGMVLIFTFWTTKRKTNMSTRTKTCSQAKKRTHGDAVIERAKQRGLTIDHSKISPYAVHRKFRLEALRAFIGIRKVHYHVPRLH